MIGFCPPLARLGHDGRNYARCGLPRLLADGTAPAQHRAELEAYRRNCRARDKHIAPDCGNCRECAKLSQRNSQKQTWEFSEYETQKKIDFEYDEKLSKQLFDNYKVEGITEDGHNFIFTHKEPGYKELTLVDGKETYIEPCEE